MNGEMGLPGQRDGCRYRAEVVVETRRSAELRATSVPEPRASPRSAWDRTGPSLTPSPTIATR